MIETEKIIQQRIELCDNEVDPLLKKKNEELTGITITPNRFKEYIEAIGQKTMRLAGEIEEPTLSAYDHYLGRLYGIQMVHKLFNLTKAPKVAYINEDGDAQYADYMCGHCGCKVCIEDANFCPKCGVMLYFEEY